VWESEYKIATAIAALDGSCTNTLTALGTYFRAIPGKN
jgi:hypothetical protein